MDTKNLSNKITESKKDNKNNVQENKQIETLNRQAEQKDKQVLAKDEEIRQLKASLAESQKINKTKKGDVRAEVNRQGDTKLKCIGVDESGKRLWRKANELTDADIERMEQYRAKIRQNNAKKY